MAFLRPPRAHAQEKTGHAQEQDRPDVLSAREAWFDGQLDLDPETLVFVDETGASTKMARLHGRAPRGERLRMSSVIRWTARAVKEGSPKPRKQGRPAGKGPLAEHLDYLIAVVEAKPDITMPELAARLDTERGVTAAWASLSKLLCRAGFT